MTTDTKVAKAVDEGTSPVNMKGLGTSEQLRAAFRRAAPPLPERMDRLVATRTPKASNASPRPPKPPKVEAVTDDPLKPSPETPEGSLAQKQVDMAQQTHPDIETTLGTPSAPHPQTESGSKAELQSEDQPKSASESTAETPVYRPRKIKPNEALEFAVNFTGISAAELKGPRRSQEIAKPRMTLMYFISAVNGNFYSTTQIGGVFGGRDHATVIHARYEISDLRVLGPPQLRGAVTKNQTAALALLEALCTHFGVDLKTLPIYERSKVRRLKGLAAAAE